MRLLVLGGTAFLGREVARAGLLAGHDVTCVARGSSGAVADGAALVRHDRSAEGLGGVEDESWDAVVDVAREPAQVRRAVAALAGRVAHWSQVSTGNVYADHSVVGADESTALLAPLEEGGDGPDEYGAKKVACEQHVLDGVGTEHVLVARAGLLGGPGDTTGRTGWYPWRFAHPAADAEVLVPDALDDPAQVLDARDLAAWLVRCAEERVAGVVDAVGPTTTFGAVLAASREAAASTAEPVPAGARLARGAGGGRVDGSALPPALAAVPRVRGLRRPLRCGGPRARAHDPPPRRDPPRHPGVGGAAPGRPATAHRPRRRRRARPPHRLARPSS